MQYMKEYPQFCNSLSVGNEAPPEQNLAILQVMSAIKNISKDIYDTLNIKIIS